MHCLHTRLEFFFLDFFTAIKSCCNPFTSFYRPRWQISPDQFINVVPFIYLKPEKHTPFGRALRIVHKREFFTRKMFKCISNIAKHLNLPELLSVPLLLVLKNIVIVLSYVAGFTSAMAASVYGPLKTNLSVKQIAGLHVTSRRLCRWWRTKLLLDLPLRWELKSILV